MHRDQVEINFKKKKKMSSLKGEGGSVGGVSRPCFNWKYKICDSNCTTMLRACRLADESLSSKEKRVVRLKSFFSLSLPPPLTVLNYLRLISLI